MSCFRLHSCTLLSVWTLPVLPALIHLWYSWNSFPSPHLSWWYKICFLWRQYIFDFPKQEIKVYGFGSLTGKSLQSQIIDILSLEFKISSSKENHSNFILLPNLQHRQNQAEHSHSVLKLQVWIWSQSSLLIWPQAFKVPWPSFPAAVKREWLPL